MMPKVMLGAALVLAGAGAQAAGAGEYAGALRKMLTETAAGRCPSDVMADRLLAACREQLPTMAPALAGLGAVTDLTFVKDESQGDMRVETYAVSFAGGKKQIWSLGGLKDGKFAIAYTLGQ